MRYYLPVAGTHGFNGEPKGEWWYDGSPFVEYMRATFDWRLVSPRPLIWDGGLGGVPWTRRRGHLIWEGLGSTMQLYFVPSRWTKDDPDYIKIAERTVVAHSHALQGVLYACAEYDLKIDTLVSLMSPVRKDMRALASLARGNIRRWVHVHADRTDWVQIAGAVWDGAFGIFREHAEADVNIAIPGAGHSKLVRDPEWFNRWNKIIEEVER